MGQYDGRGKPLHGHVHRKGCTSARSPPPLRSCHPPRVTGESIRCQTRAGERISAQCCLNRSLEADCGRRFSGVNRLLVTAASHAHSRSQPAPHSIVERFGLSKCVGSGASPRGRMVPHLKQEGAAANAPAPSNIRNQILTTTCRSWNLLLPTQSLTSQSRKSVLPGGTG